MRELDLGKRLEPHMRRQAVRKRGVTQREGERRRGGMRDRALVGVAHDRAAPFVRRETRNLAAAQDPPERRRLENDRATDASPAEPRQTVPAVHGLKRLVERERYGAGLEIGETLRGLLDELGLVARERSEPIEESRARDPTVGVEAQDERRKVPPERREIFVLDRGLAAADLDLQRRDARLRARLRDSQELLRGRY